MSTMSEDISTEHRLRKEVQRLNKLISDQRSRNDAEVMSLRNKLKDEIKYSTKLRDALDKEYEHCEDLRNQLDERKRLVEDLRDDLEDERRYTEKLEKKLDKRARTIEKLEEELYDLEEDYADAYRALKKMNGLKAQLADARMSSAFSKDRVAQLQDEVLSLRCMSPSSPSRVIVSSSPSLRASEPRFPRSPPVNTRSKWTPIPPAVDHSSDVSDIEDDAVDDANTVTTRLSTRRSGDGLSDDEYEEAGFEQEQVPEAVVDTPEEDDAEEGEIMLEEGEPGQQERNFADREMRLAERDSQRAREAYDSGNKAFAKQLKEEAMEHRAQAREHNRTAAAQIFHSINPAYHTSTTGCQRIDLHRLHTREALEFMRNHLHLCRARNMARSEIIVGRGNHSIGGIARLKPAVLEMLERENDLEIDMSSGNPGGFHINFLDLQRRDEVREVLADGAVQFEAASRSVASVKEGLNDIERGMNSMAIGPKSSAKGMKSRKGLQDVTNRQ